MVIDVTTLQDILLISIRYTSGQFTRIVLLFTALIHLNGMIL